jgi:hypothetical protein
MYTQTRPGVFKDRHFVSVEVGQHVFGEITGVHPGTGSPALNVSLESGQDARCEITNLVGGMALLSKPKELLAMKGKRLQWIVTSVQGDRVGVRQSGSEAAKLYRRH